MISLSPSCGRNKIAKLYMQGENEQARSEAAGLWNRRERTKESRQSYKEYGRTVKWREVDKERLISTMEQTIGDGRKTLEAKNSNQNTHQ